MNGGRSCSPAASDRLSGLAGLVLVMLVHPHKIRVIINGWEGLLRPVAS